MNERLLTSETKDVNEAVVFAKESGVSVVGITGVADSTLTTIADDTILVKNSGIINHASFVNSQFSVMFVLDMMTTMLLKDPKFSSKMNDTIRLVMDRKYSKKKLG